MNKKAQELFRLAKQALLNAGAHETMAQTTAQHLVCAEEQGLPTHGMSRVPFYCCTAPTRQENSNATLSGIKA